MCMKKKKESDDILKQFYSNLSLLSPESFFFDQHLTELLLPYIQNFVKSGDRCDFGFRIKNESSSELTEINNFPNSILVPKASSSRFNENIDENESIFDNCSKYNDYIKQFMKKNRIFCNFKKEFLSHLYFQSSQRLIFLAICHLIRPKIIKKIILDQKKERKDQNRWRIRNIFQRNLENEDPANFINSTMRIDDKVSGFYNNKTENSFSLLNDDEKLNYLSHISNDKLKNDQVQNKEGFNGIQNSILIDEEILNENGSFLKNNEENQNKSNIMTYKKGKTDENHTAIKDEKQFDGDLINKENIEGETFLKRENGNDTILKPKEDDENIKHQNEISISKEENDILISQSEEEQSLALNKEAQNEKEKSIQIQNNNISNLELSAKEENVIEQNEQDEVKDEEFQSNKEEEISENDIKSDHAKSDRQNEEEEENFDISKKERSIDVSNILINENSVQKDEEENYESSNKKEKSIENQVQKENSESENEDSIQEEEKVENQVEKEKSKSENEDSIQEEEETIENQDKIKKSKSENEDSIQEEEENYGSSNKKEESIESQVEKEQSKSENENHLQKEESIKDHSKIEQLNSENENYIQKEESIESQVEKEQLNSENENYIQKEESIKDQAKIEQLNSENENTILEEEIIEDHSKIEQLKSENEKSLLEDDNTQDDSYLTECSKDEIQFTKSEDDYSIQKDEEKRFNTDASSILEEEIEEAQKEADASKSSFSMIRPFINRKRVTELNLSNLSISHNEKLQQMTDQNRTEVSITANENDKIGFNQTATGIPEYSDEETDFDFDFSKTQVFDELSLSFLEMRTNVQGRITRSTEPLFEKWSQISCCLFFEFISRDFGFSSLKNNSSFAAKFEDFVRSLVKGFVSAEKQSYHDGVMSLLPSESKFFYVTSLVTLDSISNENEDKKEKEKKDDKEENDDFLIDNKYMFYHHRRGIQISSTAANDTATTTDSIFNTTVNSEAQQTYSFTNQTGLRSSVTMRNSSQKVNGPENDFSVSKFMNPILASYRSAKDESVESFSMKIMLAKAVHANAMKESRILFDVSEPSPLISRALELRGVTPPRKPPDPSNYSPRKLRKSGKKFFEPTEPEKMPKNQSEVHSPRSKKKINSRLTDEKIASKPKIKVNHVNSKNSVQSSTAQNSVNDTFFTFNRKIKSVKNEKKAKNKNKENEKRNQIRFDQIQNDDDQKSTEKKKPLKTSIRRVRLAESKGFIVREKAVEQHNRGVLNDYEVKKRAIYRDICSNEAKCAEEIEKYASNGKLIMHSNIGKSVLYDKLEKNLRNKQTNKSYDRLNGRKIVYGMEYDTDFSQLEGPIATAILEDGLY